MHQSPQKLPAARRDKHPGRADTDEGERMLYRGSAPKARKFLQQQDNKPERGGRQHPSRG
ncbi:MAG TPA: hypothetical protein VLJ58_17710 [Ramlibacter sp.]|nr:hypothetical protein [Ramlibacter sp.]